VSQVVPVCSFHFNVTVFSSVDALSRGFFVQEAISVLVASKPFIVFVLIKTVRSDFTVLSGRYNQKPSSKKY